MMTARAMPQPTKSGVGTHKHHLLASPTKTACGVDLKPNHDGTTAESIYGTRLSLTLPGRTTTCHGCAKKQHG